MLSTGQVETYNQDGFIIPETRLPDDVINDIKARHARLVAEHPEFRDYCPALLGSIPVLRSTPAGLRSWTWWSS